MKMETDQTRKWHAASLRIGFGVIAPFTMTLSDGSKLETTALVKVGPSKGIVVDPEWEVLQGHINQLLADGFGYSVVTLDDVDDASLREMLQDWSSG